MRKKALALIAVFALFTGYKAEAAPITFNTALPVSAEEWIFRQQFIYGRAEGTGREREDLTSLSVLAYGLTPDLTVFGVVPLTTRELDGADGSDREAEGLGDIRAFGRYTVYKDDFKGGTFRIAPFAGLELPTGENEERDEQGLLPPALQTGSGSWDLFGGIVATYGTTDFQADGQVSYQDNRKADGVEAGDIWRADASLQYRLAPEKVSAGTSGFLYGVLETNLVHQGKIRISGLSDPDTGGTKLFVAPGLQYAAKRWIAEAAVQIPVVQNLNGANLEQDYIIRTGFRINF